MFGADEIGILRKLKAYYLPQKYTIFVLNLNFDTLI